MFRENDVRIDSSSDDDPETSDDELDDVPIQSSIREKRATELPW